MMKTLLAAAAASLALAAGPAAADGMPYRPAPKKARIWRAPPPAPLPPAPEPIFYEEPLPPPPPIHHGPMEVTLGSDFFSGGESSVGGFPSYASYGGGGGYVVVGAGASAHAFASARASVSVSVRGGHRGRWGGKGGHCCKGGGGKKH
jgi:hypothetical protein